MLEQGQQQARAAATDPAVALEALRAAVVAFAEADLQPSRVLRSALEALLEVTGADAGAVAVPGEAAGRVRLLAERRLGRAGPVSSSALAAILQEASPRATITEPPVSQSVASAAISSILCTPVRRQGRTLAAVYLDRRGDRPAFDGTARSLAECFAATLALAVDLGQQVEVAEHLRERAEARADEALGWAGHLHDFWKFGSLSTKSHRFAECLAAAERIARFHVDVLVQGETGTGKEFLARCIHEASGRRGGFVAVNCTTLPESLADNELFGHEPGAYTGALRLYRGCVEQAQDGTLFLDEIADLPAAVQPKLLRVLENRCIRRVGGERELAVDLRIIAATNRDLQTEVRAGRFREDLYYRLQVVQLELPPLRDRLEDLPALAALLLRLAGQEVGRTDLAGWDPAAIRLLGRHAWPGNVRELKNAIKRLCVLAEGPHLRPQDVERHLGHLLAAEPAPASAAVVQGAAARPAGLTAAAPAPAPPEGSAAMVLPATLAAAAAVPDLAPGRTLRRRVRDAERQLIEAAIRQEGSIAAAARLFRIRRQTLHDKCQRLGITEPKGPAAARE